MALLRLVLLLFLVLVLLVMVVPRAVSSAAALHSLPFGEVSVFW